LADEFVACKKELDELKRKPSEFLDGYKTAMRERDPLKQQYYERAEKLAEQLAACEKDLDTANAALDAKIDICGDERITELKGQLASMTKERDAMVKVIAEGLESTLIAGERRLRYEVIEQLSAVTKERDHWKEMNSLHLAQLHIRVEEILAGHAREQQLRDALNECLTNIASGRFDQDMVEAALSLPHGTLALDELRKDAARYQWLKDGGKAVSIDYFKGHFRAVDVVTSLVLTDWVDSFDEAVDAAMQEPAA
jgi:hypothetical protein